MSFELDAAERLEAVKAHITLDGSDDGEHYSIATSRQLPWHEFGPNFLEDMDIDKALKESHTDYDVIVQELTTPWLSDDGVETIVANDVTARIAPNPYTGKPVYLGSVPRGIPVIQNREALEWAYDILGAVRGDGDKGLITSVGTWKQQRKFFATLILPDTIRVGGVDPVNLYLSILEHHDGGGALTACTSPVRWECRNTTTIGLKKAKSRVGLRHTSGIKARMSQVRNLLGITEDYTAAFAKMADEMWEKEFNDLQFFDMVEHLRGERPEDDGAAQTWWDKTYDAMLSQRTAPENAGSQVGSGWNAFQAVVSYDNYVRGTSGKADEQQANRAGAVLLGANDRVEEKAMAYILAAR